MTDISISETPVQSEAVRFRSSVSESLMQGMGGAINLCLANVLPLGSIIHSMLTESQFQGETSAGWVLADGRDCSASNYAALTGITTVPDMRGVFLRAKNNGRSTSTGNEGGDLSLGTYEADRFQQHTHTSNASTVSEIGGPIVHDDGSEFAVVPVTNTGYANGRTSVETSPRSLTVNIFFRIN